MIEFEEFLSIIKGGSNKKEGATDDGTGAIYEFFNDLTSDKLMIDGKKNIPFSLFISSSRRRKCHKSLPNRASINKKLNLGRTIVLASLKHGKWVRKIIVYSARFIRNCTYHLKGLLVAWVRSCSLRAFLQLNNLGQFSILHLKNIWLLGMYGMVDFVCILKLRNLFNFISLLRRQLYKYFNNESKI